jgi:TetR/AcrR family transcriptional regulator, cholesterol catabolism regulator
VDDSTPMRKGMRTAAAIRQAAVEMFFTHGYQATTLRELAAACDIKVGSLYNHIDSKETLLEELMVGIMRDLFKALEDGVAQFTSPVDRLRAAIQIHVAFHAQRAKEVFIGNSELRSLPPGTRDVVVGLRDQYEQLIKEIIEDGISAGDFDKVDPKLAVYAIVAVGTHVSNWYRPDGRLSLEDIARFHSDFLITSLVNRGHALGRDLLIDVHAIELRATTRR